jgi:peptidase E
MASLKKDEKQPNIEMNTKYILHGGFAPHQKQEDDPFFREILKDAPETTKILLVYFAKEADRIPKNKEEDVDQFNKNRNQKKLSFDVASEESFLKQIEWADIVYLRGGDTIKLLEVLKKFSDLKGAFRGKIIAGDSAGANALSKVCYSKKADQVCHGLGILPIGIICHYSEKLKDKLKDYNSNLEILFLSEYEFKVINS